MSETPESDVAEARRALAAAEAALTRAREARDGDRRSVEETEAALAAVDTRLLATAPTDTRTLVKLDGERTGLRVALEVLRRARVPRTQAALEEAERTLVEAQRELLKAEQILRFRQLKAERTRLEEDLAARVEPLFAGPGPEENLAARVAPALAEIRELLRELNSAWWSGWNFIRSLRGGAGHSTKSEAERSRVWPSSRWPHHAADDSDAGLLVALERVFRPRNFQEEHDRAVREGNDRASMRFVEGVLEARAQEGRARERARVFDSGLGEAGLARLRAQEEERQARLGEQRNETTWPPRK